MDEIDALSAADQSRLLAVFEDWRLPKLSDTRGEKRRLDVTIVVSSNHFLDRLVKQGKFRKDLYYRMSVICIEIPPLRERLGDVSLLADHFLRTFRISKSNASTNSR